ncbi:hypothetical protein ACFQ8S_06510 [Streptomyces virginiae]|uniref:hypothetical protein n=1 Tax=Streptomyces virginiae TaxID=1961 RepID=UPI0036BA0D23
MSDDKPWVIFDEWVGAYCTLPANNTPKGEAPTLLPLEFDSCADAQRWMDRCYTTWAEWSRGRGKHKVPEHWQGFIPPVMSPWQELRTTPTTDYWAMRR